MKRLLYVFCFIWFTHSTVKAQQNELGESLIGTHQFGVQFIWDGYGSSEITKKDGTLYFKGEQYSNDQEEYLLMEGSITLIDDRNFTFNGSLKLFTEGCCGLLDRTVTYTFRKIGKRKPITLSWSNMSKRPCSYNMHVFSLTPLIAKSFNSNFDNRIRTHWFELSPLGYW